MKAVKQPTPRLFFYIEEPDKDRRRFYAQKPLEVFEHKYTKRYYKPYKIRKERGLAVPPELISKKHNHIHSVRRISVCKMEIEASGRAYSFTVNPGRKVYVIVRWHPDLQLTEFVHVVTTKKRAFAYIRDTFESLINSVGLPEVMKIYKVVETIAW